MPPAFPRDGGENGLLGSGSMGRVFCGCCAQVSQEPSDSDTRNRLSLNSAVSLSLSPATGTGMADAGFGRGPGSLALNHERWPWASMADVPITAATKTHAARRFVAGRFMFLNLPKRTICLRSALR